MKYLFLFLLCFSNAAQAQSLKVLSFNTWLLEVYDIDLADEIKPRREKMIQAIKDVDADVVNLIEVWQTKHANYLVKALKEQYPYCSFSPDEVRTGSAYSNGLLVLSKFPLKKSTRIIKKPLPPSGRELRTAKTYPQTDKNGFYENGCQRPLDVLAFKKSSRFDEFIVSKGALYNVIEHPQLGSIDFFSSHLGALSFDPKKNDYSAKHKQAVQNQMLELVLFMADHTSSTNSILAIDSNRHFRLWNAQDGESRKLDPSYSLMRDLSYKDSYMSYRGFDPKYVSGLYTYDNKNNHYAGGGAFAKDPADFIDYIWVKSDDLQVVDSRLVFNEGQAVISDHYGVLTTLGK